MEVEGIVHEQEDVVNNTTVSFPNIDNQIKMLSHAFKDTLSSVHENDSARV